MKTNRIIGNKYRPVNSSKKTLAYIGENLKMQKKIAYRNSEQYIAQQSKLLADAYCKQYEERQRKRWAEMDRLEELNKKNGFQKFKENAMDIFFLVFGLLITPIITMYDDIKKEFLGNK